MVPILQHEAIERHLLFGGVKVSPIEGHCPPAIDLKLSPSLILPSLHLRLAAGFTSFLLGPESDLFNLCHCEVFQDMTQSLSDYHIASSHNTYVSLLPVYPLSLSYTSSPSVASSLHLLAYSSSPSLLCLFLPPSIALLPLSLSLLILVLFLLPPSLIASSPSLFPPSPSPLIASFSLHFMFSHSLFMFSLLSLSLVVFIAQSKNRLYSLHLQRLCVCTH